MVVLTMSCLSILFSVAILSLHHQRGKPRRVPNIIRCIAFSIIAPVLCLKLKSTKIKRNIIRQNSMTPKKKFSDNKPDLFPLEGKCLRPAMQPLNTADEYETFFADDNTCDLELIHLQERQDAVNDLINWLYRKHKSELNEDISFQEWRDVAYVADRLLFVLFLGLNVIATAIILTMRPVQDISGFLPISVSNT